MAGYILHSEEENLVLRGVDVDTLLRSGNGDAALLYLAVMRASGGQDAKALADTLRMSQLRMDDAEAALQNMGLLPGGERKTPVPHRERTDFTAEEMASILTDPDFSMLHDQVERKLGKGLSRGDDQILASLYHDRGLPPDVLYLLVNHCVERYRRRFGPGRNPAMRDVEREGARWADQGIFDQESASRYLQEYDRKMEERARRITASAPYMRALGLGDRQPRDSELKYLTAWMDQGFPPETVSAACDITVLRKQKLEWRYLNGVLRSWHEKGWHTPEEVERGEPERKPERKRAPVRKTVAPTGGTTAATDTGNSWANKYVKR